MKNLYLLIFSILLATSSFGQLIITGVIDGPLSGGTPKAIELYATESIPDLSIYGVSSANNGGGATGNPELTLAGSAAAGDLIYVASESPQFEVFFGFAPDYTDDAANINGDDAIELFKDGAVIDVFGDVNVDGTGQPWEHLDGWAYRVNSTGPDGSTFVIENWTFSGPNALDGESTNATAATPFPVGTYSATGEATPRAALPVFSPEGGAYADSVVVSISTATEGATIFYSFGNEDPVTEYTGEFTFKADTTLNAIAVADGFDTSFVATATYTVIPTTLEPGVLFSESFELNYDGQFTVPDGWNEVFLPNSKTDRGFGSDNRYGRNGGVAMRASSFGGDTGVDSVWLVLIEKLDFTNARSGEISQWVSSEFDGDGELTFQWSIDSVEWFRVGRFDTLLPEKGSDAYTEIKFDVPAAALDNEIYIAYRWYGASNSNSASYEIDDIKVTFEAKDQVAATSFTPAPGIYTDSVDVTLATETPDATIFYTTNGTTPDSSGIEYLAPIRLKQSATIKAIAYAVGFNPSNISEASYTVIEPTVDTVEFSPMGGDYNGPVTVELSSSTPDAEIYYTLDGTDPDNVGNGTQYTAPFELTDTTEVKAIGYASGYLASPISAVTYNISAPVSIADARAAGVGSQVKVTGIVTSAGTLSSLNRTFQDETGGLLVRGGGSDELQIGDSIIVSGELGEFRGLLQISSGTIKIEVISSANDLPAPTEVSLDQIEESLESQLISITDVYFTDEGNFEGSTNYTITDGSENLDLRIATSSHPLTGTVIPFNFVTVTGVLGQFDDNYQVLPVDADGVQEITPTEQVANPVFDPAAGTYFETQEVTATTSTADAVIYYTTDGTTPSDASFILDRPILVEESLTVQAFARARGFLDSDVVTAEYIITDPPITAIEQLNGMVYPNPARDVIMIREEVDIARLYNMNGALLVEYTHTSSLQVSSLSAGTYIMELIDNDSTTRTLIIKE